MSPQPQPQPRKDGPVYEPIWPGWKQPRIVTCLGSVSLAAGLFALFMTIFHYLFHLL